jgi:hypothetical protein
MQPSNVTDLLFKELNYRGERQKVIASNIANIPNILGSINLPNTAAEASIISINSI